MHQFSQNQGQQIVLLIQIQINLELIMSILYFWGKPITKQLFQLDSTHNQRASVSTSIKNVFCGDRHCVFINSRNELYGFGDNSEGQLGSQQARTSGLGLTKISIRDEPKIIQVSCGWQHTLLLDQLGQVYSSGRGDHGQLGLRNTQKFSFEFQVVLKQARQISAGKDHSLALCASKVMGWGNSRQGQLGLLIKKDYSVPKQLNVYPCSYIFAGDRYSLFVTSKGVYGTGKNESCQLGLGHENTVYVPKKLLMEEEIIQISGGSYCAAATQTRQWYLWGSGGLGIFKYPTKMSFLKGAQSVSIGTDFGVLSRGTHVWVWGYNRWGEIGTNRQVEDYVCEAEQLSNLNLSRVVCGGNFVVGFTNNIFDKQKEPQNNNCQLIEIRQSNAKQITNENALQNQHVQDYKIAAINRDPQLCKQDSSAVANKQLSPSWQIPSGDHHSTQDQIQQTAYQYNNRQFQPKKIVRLSSSLKRLTKTSLSFLQQQNQNLRQELQKERIDKRKLYDNYINLMSEARNKAVWSRIQQIKQGKVGSREYQQQQQKPLDNLNEKLHVLKQLLESASR